MHYNDREHITLHAEVRLVPVTTKLIHYTEFMPMGKIPTDETF